MPINNVFRIEMLKVMDVHQRVQFHTADLLLHPDGIHERGSLYEQKKKIKNKSLAVVNASGSLLHLECMGSCSLCASGPNTVVLLNKLELETASS